MLERVSHSKSLDFLYLTIFFGRPLHSKLTIGGFVGYEHRTGSKMSFCFESSGVQLPLEDVTVWPLVVCNFFALGIMSLVTEVME